MSNTEETFDLSEILDFGAYVPEGEDYVGKVIAIEDGTTKGGYPKITATFEVTRGDSRGLTMDKMYLLFKRTTKNGKTSCMGIDDLRNDARMLGVTNKLPKSFTLSTAKRAFAAILNSTKNITFDVRKVPDKEGKLWSRIFITGKKLNEENTTEESTDLLGDAFA